MKENKTYAGRLLKDWYDIFVNELKMIFSDGGVLIIFFLGGLLYPLLYNFIYHDGTVDKMPVAVVNMSGGEYSRRYLQKLNATRECEVAYNCVSLAEAEELMKHGKVHGIIYVPGDFDERIVRMEQGIISTYADMSSFLYYKNMTTATSAVMFDEMHLIKSEHYAAAGFVGEQAAQLTDPIKIDQNIPYNKAFSYTIFFIIAALFLVLQQTMFYGSSIMAGTMREQNRSFASMPYGLNGRGIGRVVLGRGAAYVAVYLVIGSIVALLLPWLFHLPQNASVGDIMILLAFFLVDCVFFCFTWSTMITKRETVFVLFLFMSPICLFLTGFSWPQSAFPTIWKYFSYIFPSTFGVRAFINLNSASGTLVTIAPEMVAMTVQTVVYYFLACLAVFIEGKVLQHKDRLKAVKDAINRKRGLDPVETAYIIRGRE